jgi:hypothetical protein
MRLARVLSVLLGAGALFAGAGVARAGNPLVVFPPHPERLRAVRYGDESGEQCLAELVLRGVPFGTGPKVPTIETPVRLTGTLRGVKIEMHHPTAVAPKDGPVMDCRLLLALDDLAIVAADHAIVSVRYNSLYRGRWARHRGWRHAAGVAIDVVELVKKNGEVLNVLSDFHGEGIGKKTCGPGAPVPVGRKALELRRFVCDVDATGSFNLILTPHYDQRHQNHFHLEVRRDIPWFLTQ